METSLHPSDISMIPYRTDIEINTLRSCGTRDVLTETFRAAALYDAVFSPLTGVTFQQ